MILTIVAFSITIIGLISICLYYRSRYIKERNGRLRAEAQIAKDILFTTQQGTIFGL